MMRRRARAAVRFAGLAASAAFLVRFAAAQAPAATTVPTVIRAETQLVLVDAVVRDRRGNPVHDLTAKDFRVWEDGREQTITSLSVETSAASPEKAARHYLALFFDDSTLAMSDQLAARRDAARFVGAWSAPDRYMSVVNFGPDLRIAQDFTALPDKLIQAVGAVQTGGAPPSGAVPTADNVQLDSWAPSAAQSGARGGRAAPSRTLQPPPLQDGATFPYGQLDLLDGVRLVADSMASVRGRKALVLFTSGFPDPPSAVQLANVISACNRANVAVYVTNAPNFKSLAEETGGRVIANANAIVDELGKVAEEQEEQYVLGYTPAESPKGSCHALRVAVDRPGVEVLARKGYCSEKPVDLALVNPAEKDIEARAAAPSAHSLAASMQLPYFYASPNVARVNLAMEIATESIKFEKVKGKQHAELHITGAASKPDGEVAGRFSDAVDLDFETAKDSDAFGKQPYHYEYQFDLAPGQYRLHVTVDAGSGSLGSVELPLSIAPWDGRGLGLSGVALSKVSRAIPDMASDLDASLLEDRRPLVAGGHQIVPSGSSRFHRADLKLVYLEAYDPSLAGPDPPALSLRIRVLDRKTNQQEADLGSFSLANFIRPGNPVVPVAFNLPATLPSGDYRLEVTAAQVSASTSVVRTADFEIDP